MGPRRLRVCYEGSKGCRFRCSYNEGLTPLDSCNWGPRMVFRDQTQVVRVVFRGSIRPCNHRPCEDYIGRENSRGPRHCKRVLPRRGECRNIMTYGADC